jgi:hypothetical protein
MNPFPLVPIKNLLNMILFSDKSVFYEGEGPQRKEAEG